MSPSILRPVISLNKDPVAGERDLFENSENPCVSRGFEGMNQISQSLANLGRIAESNSKEQGREGKCENENVGKALH